MLPVASRLRSACLGISFITFMIAQHDAGHDYAWTIAKAFHDVYYLRYLCYGRKVKNSSGPHFIEEYMLDIAQGRRCAYRY